MVRRSPPFASLSLSTDCKERLVTDLIHSARRAAALLLPAVIACTPAMSRGADDPAVGRTAASPSDRHVPRHIPMTPMIRRAHAAGTRDSTGTPGRRYWQNRADYRIVVSLDPATATIRGEETIVYRNNSPDSLSTIVLRLFQNYFRPEVARNDYVTDITEGMVIEQLAVNGSKAAFAPRPKLDPNATVQVIPLARAIPAGGSATIHVVWRSKVPNVERGVRGQRMGRWENDLFQLAQWYPQVAMYDDLRGWNDDIYRGDSEFYNEYGSFDVRITVPAGFLVGATGTLQNPSAVLSKQTRDRLAIARRSDTTVHVVTPAERGAGEGRGTAAGDKLTWHFTSELTNDFAWAAARTYAYDAGIALAPDTVMIHTLFDPARDYSKTTGYAKFALEWHAKKLMPYGFPALWIVDGPEGGMEYPMIIFNGPGFGVTNHETTHQWFPMMVATNENWYGWMDEGFAGYLNRFARIDFDGTAPDAMEFGAGYRRVAGSELEAAMMWPGDLSGPNYSTHTYGKMPVVLRALGAMVGDSAVIAAMGDYAKAWQWKHPSPWDFYFFMNRRLGYNLDWFWHQWMFTTGTVDQGIASVTVEAGRTRVTVSDRGEMAMPVILGVEYTDGTIDTILRPVDMWFGGARTATIDVPGGGRGIRRLMIDPENRFQDLRRADNVWPR